MHVRSRLPCIFFVALSFVRLPDSHAAFDIIIHTDSIILGSDYADVFYLNAADRQHGDIYTWVGYNTTANPPSAANATGAISLTANGQYYIFCSVPWPGNDPTAPVSLVRIDRFGSGTRTALTFGLKQPVVASATGAEFYVADDTIGIFWVIYGFPATASWIVRASNLGVRSLVIFRNRLYACIGSSPSRIVQVGTNGLPRTIVALNTLPGFAVRTTVPRNIKAMAFRSTSELYVLDWRSGKAQIYRNTFNGSMWVERGVINTGVDTPSAFSMCGSVNSTGSFNLYVANQTRGWLVDVTGGKASTIAFAIPDEVFIGIAPAAYFPAVSPSATPSVLPPQSASSTPTQTGATSPRNTPVITNSRMSTASAVRSLSPSPKVRSPSSSPATTTVSATPIAASRSGSGSSIPTAPSSPVSESATSTASPGYSASSSASYVVSESFSPTPDSSTLPNPSSSASATFSASLSSSSPTQSTGASPDAPSSVSPSVSVSGLVSPTAQNFSPTESATASASPNVTSTLVPSISTSGSPLASVSSSLTPSATPTLTPPSNIACTLDAQISSNFTLLHTERLLVTKIGCCLFEVVQNLVNVYPSVRLASWTVRDNSSAIIIASSSVNRASCNCSACSLSRQLQPLVMDQPSGEQIFVSIIVTSVDQPCPAFREDVNLLSQHWNSISSTALTCSLRLAAQQLNMPFAIIEAVEDGNAEITYFEPSNPDGDDGNSDILVTAGIVGGVVAAVGLVSCYVVKRQRKRPQPKLRRVQKAPVRLAEVRSLVHEPTTTSPADLTAVKSAMRARKLEFQPTAVPGSTSAVARNPMPMEALLPVELITALQPDVHVASWAGKATNAAVASPPSDVVEQLVQKVQPYTPATLPINVLHDVISLAIEVARIATMEDAGVVSRDGSSVSSAINPLYVANTGGTPATAVNKLNAMQINTAAMMTLPAPDTAERAVTDAAICAAIAAIRAMPPTNTAAAAADASVDASYIEYQLQYSGEQALRAARAVRNAVKTADIASSGSARGEHAVFMNPVSSVALPNQFNDATMERQSVNPLAAYAGAGVLRGLSRSNLLQSVEMTAFPPTSSHRKLLAKPVTVKLDKQDVVGSSV